MAVEAVVAALVGAAALWLVLRPIFVPPRPKAAVYRAVDPEETAKGVALTALKEIEFDRETGKLSDADYELLKRKYTAAALEALRVEEAANPPGRRRSHDCRQAFGAARREARLPDLWSPARGRRVVLFGLWQAPLSTAPL